VADRQVDSGLRERGRRLSSGPDVAIIGGGIIGCAAAAFLAEAGARVELFEQGELAGAASGRNSGVLQHPFDPVLAALYEETLRHARGLDGLDLPSGPAGLLMLAKRRGEVEPLVADMRHDFPELRPELLDPARLREAEPALADRLWACRLESGYPLRPAAITLGFAERARRLGAHLREGATAWPWATGGRVHGVLTEGARRHADAVMVAAGPWTPELIDPTRGWRPIGSVWGVVVELRLDRPPSHVLEQVGVEAVGVAAPTPVFSAVTAGGVTSVGSTFLRDEPDAQAWAAPVLDGATAFLPGLNGAGPPSRVRTCARPQSFDGRPLIGPYPDVDGLWCAAGHGPWGISTGAASARLVADAMLGRGEIPAPLALARSL
jgi:glycine/D-amino acid oxidase-like deaminating enzyme